MSSDKQLSEQYYNDRKNDEIDLIALVKELWKGKLIIFVCTGLAAALCIIYTLQLQYIYSVKLELIPPQENALEIIKPVISKSDSEMFLYTPDAPLKQQQQLLDLAQRNNTNNTIPTIGAQKQISAKAAFSLLLKTLESDSHINRLITKHPDILKLSLGIIPEDGDTIDHIKKNRHIQYANTQTKNNELIPDSYFIIIEGKDRDHLKELILKDIELASEFTNHQITNHYIGQVNQLLTNATSQNDVETRAIDRRLAAREWYLLRSHENDLAQLKEELFIAKKIGDNQKITLLTAKLEALELRSKTTFFDDDFLSIQAQKKLIESSSYIDQLKSEIKRLEKHRNEIKFSSDVVVSPINPIKPSKITIIAVGLLFGFLMGIGIIVLRLLIRAITNES